MVVVFNSRIDFVELIASGVDSGSHRLTSSKVSSSKIKQFLTSSFGFWMGFVDGFSVIFLVVFSSGFTLIVSVSLLSPIKKWRLSISFTFILFRTEATSISLLLRDILKISGLRRYLRGFSVQMVKIKGIYAVFPIALTLFLTILNKNSLCFYLNDDLPYTDCNNTNNSSDENSNNGIRETNLWSSLKSHRSVIDSFEINTKAIKCFHCVIMKGLIA